MFKKIAHILLVSLLLVSTSGISLNKHYCGNSLMSFSFFSVPQHCCPGHCDKCHNTHLFNKVMDEFTGSSSGFSDLKANTIIIQANLILNASDLLLTSLVLKNIDLRKFVSLKAGDSPALICNFRC
jgi:hypothetical protein